VNNVCFIKGCLFIRNKNNFITRAMYDIIKIIFNICLVYFLRPQYVHTNDFDVFLLTLEHCNIWFVICRIGLPLFTDMLLAWSHGQFILRRICWSMSYNRTERRALLLRIIKTMKVKGYDSRALGFWPMGLFSIIFLLRRRQKYWQI
jgi:hypothetical protein